MSDKRTALEELKAFEPEIGLVLGSGLGDYGEKLENRTYVSYSDIPGMPVSKVAGHQNRFVLGTRFGRRIIAMQGRVHYYEGFAQRQIALPIRIMKDAGVKFVILTNAAGGINLSYVPGDLMVITDQINLSGSNPLIGDNDDKYGPRFPDMSQVYDREIRQKLLCVAEKEGIALREGVYIMFSGPQYETPAEIRMARTLGADAVGMSTVPEAIAARHAGLKVAGISCITNMAAGILDRQLSHSEVCETAERVGKTFSRVVDLLIRDAAAEI